MINYDKIIKGAGTVVLVAALAAGGVAFSNGEKQDKILNSNRNSYSSDVELPVEEDVLPALTDNDKKELDFDELPKIDTSNSSNTEAVEDVIDLPITKEETSEEEIELPAVSESNSNVTDNVTSVEEDTTKEDETPMFVVPERIELEDDTVGLKVPKGYSVYQATTIYPTYCMLGVLEDESEDYDIYYGPIGASMDGYIGVKRKQARLVVSLDNFKISLQNKTCNSDLYIEPTRETISTGSVVLTVPTGYDIYYYGDGEEVSMLGVNRTDTTNKFVGPVGATLDEYVGITNELSSTLKYAEGIKNEMRNFYDQQFGKTID